MDKTKKNDSLITQFSSVTGEFWWIYLLETEVCSVRQCCHKFIAISKFKHSLISDKKYRIYVISLTWKHNHEMSKLLMLTLCYIQTLFLSYYSEFVPYDWFVFKCEYSVFMPITCGLLFVLMTFVRSSKMGGKNIGGVNCLLLC